MWLRFVLLGIALTGKSKYPLTKSANKETLDEITVDCCCCTLCIGISFFSFFFNFTVLYVFILGRLFLRHKLTELAHSFLFRSFVCFCLHGPFNCISFHELSRQLSVFSLCSSGLISALLALSAIYLFVKVSFSPDIIPRGCLCSIYQLTN